MVDLLPDGRVLVTGGYSSTTGAKHFSSEIYDPNADTWTAAGDMAVRRSRHTANLLSNGQVLVVGGETVDKAGPSADTTGDRFSHTSEVFDPEYGSFYPVGNMSNSRMMHTATALSSGEVMILGGKGEQGEYVFEVEVFDPQSGQFSTVSTVPENRDEAIPFVLPDGTVLIRGGGACCQPGLEARSSAALYFPREKRFETIATGLPDQKESYTPFLLSDGRVMIMGGTPDPSRPEVYDPRTRQFTVLDLKDAIGSELYNPAYGDSVVPLLNGTVLIKGSFIYFPPNP